MANYKQAAEELFGTQDEAATPVEPTTPQAPASTGSKWQQAADEVFTDQQAQRRTKLLGAVRTNPDQQAEALKLSKETGLPSDVVVRNLLDVKMQRAVDDYDKKLPTAPVLDRLMREGTDFAKVAHDDIDRLIGLHGELKEWRGPAPTAANIARGLAQSLPQGLRSMRENLRLITGDLLDSFGILPRSELEKQEDIRRAAQVAAETAHSTPEFETATGAGIYGGLSSTLRQLPGLALSVATMNPAPSLLSAGVGSGAEAYGRYRARGATAGEAAAGGILEGTIEVATEYLPMSFFVNKLAKANVGQFVTGLLAREIPGEQVATLLQDAVDTAIANPDKTWNEYLQERPGAAYQTLVATITQSLVMGGGAKAIQRIATNADQTQRALDDGEKLQRMTQAAAESTLRQRSPEEFARAMQEIAEESDDAPNEVFIDARTLAETLQQSGITDQELASMLPSVPAQIAEAIATDGLVAIPIGEYLAGVPGSKVEEALFQNVRTSPEAPTFIEAQEAQKMAQEYLQTEAEAVIAQAENAEVLRAEQSQVEQDIVAQLNATGRFRPEVMQAYASLVSNFYTTMAQRTGQTPLELYNAKKLTIQATDPTGATNILNSGEQDGSIDATAGAASTAAATQTGGFSGPGGVGGGAALLENARRPYQSNGRLGTTLIGLPAVVKVDGTQVEFAGFKPAQDAAASYMAKKGLPYNPPKTYAKVNKERAQRIAAEFDKMKHDPQNPEVKAAYDAMIQETKEQYQAMLDAGVVVEFIDFAKTGDPYGNPRNAILDVVENNHMWVFSTRDGFGTDANFDPSDNPLLAETEYEISGQKALVNDLFRAVHDYFGHIKNGVGFRADGEENAWRAHASMYSPLARRAATTETRGQNSWVNFGPYGESNQTASPEATHFADQKIGLLPEWVSEEGAGDDADVLNQLVSTRLPSAKSAPENPLASMLVVGLESSKAEPKAFAKNIALIRQYDNVPDELQDASDDEVAEWFIGHVERNLLWLFDQVPAATRERSKLWYEGARHIVDRWVADYGITDMQAAGMLAVLSPQKDWFQNVSLSERVLDIMATKQDYAWDDEMSSTAAQILPADKFGDDVESIKGKTLGELADDSYLQAIFVRVYDQTHNNRNYRIVSPEGRFEEWSTLGSGTNATAAWGSFGEIAKAVSIYKDGSVENVSEKLGAQHKVRNFYNNIFDPHSPHGDVTIDTHAVAAGLVLPLSGASSEVGHNFGTGTGNSSKFGSKGTYGIYAEAYRRAAAQRGVLAREMQSITWEAVRGLFGARFKAQQSNVDNVRSIWQEFKHGRITEDEARERALEAAGGIAPPEWDRPDNGTPAESWTSSYQGELDRSERAGGAAGLGARGDAGGGATDGRLFQSGRTDGQGGAGGGSLGAAQVPGSVGKTYGTAREGAHPPIMAYHFSRQPRTTLTSGAYGTGLQGAEMARLEGADPRLKQRVYFYIDRGTGINPEAGVGGYAHSVTLNNVYDADADSLRLLRDAGGFNNFELAVVKAGFDGYLTRDAGPSGNVVLLGPHAVGVDQMGPQTRFSGQVVPKAQDKVLNIGEQIVANKDLPQGQLKGARWLQVLTEKMPEVVQHYGAGNPAFAKSDFMYRDGLVKALEAGLQQMAQGPRGTFSPDQLTITLTNNADLSTFLHESGHFFLTMMADLASQPNAPAQVQEDMARILAWFGIKEKAGVPPLQRWNAMTLSEQRKYHERWAESFEQYLLEGKAPSLELRGPFQRFRSWLLSVYRSFKDFITGRNLGLSNEVRQVMDRMLATDDAIAEAQQVAGYEQVFKSQEESGLSPEEWIEYQKRHEDATATAIEQMQSRSLKDMKWLEGARSKYLKKLQREAKEQRKEMKREVAAEVRAMPVYAVLHFLKTGKLDADVMTGASRDVRRTLTEAGMGKVKLSTEALQALYGDGPAAPWRYLPTNVLASGAEGLDPNVLAPVFGFANGDAMVRAMVESVPEAQAVDMLTDQRMLEKYGDINSPAAMDAAVNEAIHNEARARFFATEIATLRKAMGQTTKNGRGTVNVMLAAAKQFARTITNRRKIMDLKPKAHEAAEARAGKRALEASASGKQDEAVAARRDQLLNHYAAKYAAQARQSVDKALDYLRKFDKDSVRSKLPPEYVEQIDALLDRFDLRRGTSARDIDRRQSFRQWYDSQVAMGLEPVVPESLLDESRRQSYKELSVEEFNGLVDSVKNIEHLARLKSRLLKAKDQREFQAIVDDAAASILANTKKRREEKNDAPTKFDRTRDTMRSFLSMHRKAASIIRQLDGYKDAGPVWTAIGRSMNDASDLKASMNAEAAVKFEKLFEPARKWKLQQVAQGMSLEGRLALALNWGNEDNRQRILDGEGKNLQQIQAILSTLTREQLEFVQNVWDFIDGYWPAIRDKELRISGVAPEKVEASPFVVTLADGAQVPMRGGYYPLKYNRKLSSRDTTDAAEVTKQMLQGFFTRATTRRGHTKERASQVKNMVVRKDLGVISEHINQVIHDLAWHEWLVDTNRFLSAPEIVEAVRSTVGQEMLDELTQHARDIAVGDIPAQSGFEKVLAHLRAGVSVTGMGWNLMAAALQPLGLLQSMQRIGPTWVMRGVGRWIGNPARMIAVANEVQQKSAFMRNRSMTYNREINEIFNRATRSKPLTVVQRSFFVLMQKFQMGADMPTWLGAYEKAYAEHNDEDMAIALADQAVRDSQGGGDLSDLARVQRGSPLMKLFTTFYSYFNTTYNLAAEATNRADLTKPGDVARLASDYLMLFILPSVLATMMRAWATGDDDDEFFDEELAKKMAEDQVSYMFGMMVGMRELGSAVGGFDYSGPAGTRFFSELSKLYKQAAQGEADMPLIKAAVNVGGMIAHYPAGQINKFIEGYNAWMEGEAGPEAVLVGPPRE